uniref:UNC93-like protein n=2 Tax=Timema shepardi TaxID=629360 RepID=A0A7R9B7I9_TIMSH|nr:unnamed protein product [Timema shepardi]
MAMSDVHGGVSCPSGEKWRILRNVSVLGLAFMVQFSAYTGITHLQSTVNSSGGLGTASLTSVYAGLIFSSVFLSTSVIRWLGCKRTVIASFIAYMPYIGAQFYPQFSTMIPTGLLMGLGGGPLWCAKCTYVTVVTKTFSEITRVDSEVVTVQFFAIFFTIYIFCHVWGNLVSSLVFSLDAGDVQDGVTCGANFCPSTASTTNNTNLERPSDEKIYTVAGIYLGCMVIAVCIVSFGVDSLKRYHEDTRDCDSKGASMVQLVTSTFKMLRQPRLLMLMPLSVWIGMQEGFMGADYTAAYVSCAWGIRNIGYVMICYGVTNALSAVITGSLVRLTGRVPLVLCATVLHSGVVLGLLWWEPRSHDKAVFFVMSGLWGVADGVWQIQINAMYGVLFPGQEEAAFSNFKLCTSVGYILTYSYSSYICTDVKLYIISTLMLVGVAGYLSVEWGERNRTDARLNKE